MSYFMIMKAVTNAVNEIENSKKNLGFIIGESVKYHVRGISPSRDLWHDCVVIGFTDKQIRVEFPTRYKKLAHAYQLKKNEA